MSEAGEIAYYSGRKDGLQEALDIVNKAADYLQTHPDHKLDIFDILARIITDIQVAE